MFYLILWASQLLYTQQPAPQLIDGYSNKLSYLPGESIDLFLHGTTKGNYNLQLYDLSGNPVVNFPVIIFPQHKLNKDAYEVGFGYQLTQTVKLPSLKSGIYLWDNKIPLIVKDPNRTIQILYPSNTINAYCNAGGKSLYGMNSSDNIAATTVSFLRPMYLSRHSEAFLRWIHREGFPDVGYITDQDLDGFSAIKNSKLLIIPGHSEYWTREARKNFDRYVGTGNSILLLSGNTMWWQVRYNKSKTQLICFRDATKDPVKAVSTKTISWSDPSLAYPIYASTGADFRNAGYGLKNDKGWDGYKITENSPLLEGTTLKIGSILKCPSDELDGVPFTFNEAGVPVIDQQTLGFTRIELVGYDLVSRGGKDGAGTWIVFKKTDSSGTIINTASTDWCSQRGIGSNPEIKTVTRNMIFKLLNNENVFSIEDQPAF